jgi:hypothetical protein
MFISQNMPMIPFHRRHKTDGVLKVRPNGKSASWAGHVGFLASQDLTVLEPFKEDQQINNCQASVGVRQSKS